MTQPSLFSVPPPNVGTSLVQPYAQGSDPTARACSEAGAMAAQPRAGSQSARILDCLKKHPMTLHWLTRATGLPLATVCARVGSLKRLGLVRASGETVTGPHGTANHLIEVVR